MRRPPGRTNLASNDRRDARTKSAREAFASRGLDHDVIRHRLSWFATLQGLLFIWFALIDKRAAIATSLLVCAGVAMCLPSIASAYSNPALKNWMRLLLAVFWVTLGVAQFILRPA